MLPESKEQYMLKNTQDGAYQMEHPTSLRYDWNKFPKETLNNIHNFQGKDKESVSRYHLLLLVDINIRQLEAKGDIP